MQMHAHHVALRHPHSDAPRADYGEATALRGSAIDLADSHEGLDHVIRDLHVQSASGRCSELTAARARWKFWISGSTTLINSCETSLSLDPQWQQTCLICEVDISPLLYSCRHAVSCHTQRERRDCLVYLLQLL